MVYLFRAVTQPKLCIVYGDIAAQQELLHIGQDFFHGFHVKPESGDPGVGGIGFLTLCKEVGVALGGLDGILPIPLGLSNLLIGLGPGLGYDGILISWGCRWPAP